MESYKLTSKYYKHLMKYMNEHELDENQVKYIIDNSIEIIKEGYVHDFKLYDDDKLEQFYGKYRSVRYKKTKYIDDLNVIMYNIRIRQKYINLSYDHAWNYIRITIPVFEFLSNKYNTHKQYLIDSICTMIYDIICDDIFHNYDIDNDDDIDISSVISERISPVSSYMKLFKNFLTYKEYNKMKNSIKQQFTESIINDINGSFNREYEEDYYLKSYKEQNN